MESEPELGCFGTVDSARQLLAEFGPPAYMRRGRQVQDAIAALHEKCRIERRQQLEFVGLRLGVLQALTGEWDRLATWISKEAIEFFHTLFDELRPELRVPIERATNASHIVRALHELCASVERFNGRWQAHLQTVDLDPVNRLIDGYNRYYVLEKECVVRSARLARLGFSPLPAVTRAQLAELFPMLPAIQIKDAR